MILKQGTVSPSGEGERVDRLIQKYFPELPERSVRAAVLRKDVKLDGKRVTRETRARAGQEIRIYLREDEVESEPLRVVYEDADVLLVNKPAGISVEPDGKGGVTLTDLCARYLRKKENGGTGCRCAGSGESRQPGTWRGTAMPGKDPRAGQGRRNACPGGTPPGSGRGGRRRFGYTGIPGGMPPAGQSDQRALPFREESAGLGNPGGCVPGTAAGKIL